MRLGTGLGKQLFTAIALSTASASAQAPQAPMPAPPPPPPGYAPPPGYPPPGYPPPGYPPPAYPPPPPPTEAPAAVEAKTRGYHLHDGYFMRFAGGAGYLVLEVDSSATARGPGITWQFDFGGALADGVVLGGSYTGLVASNVTVEGTRTSGDASLLQLGPFVSVFPDPRGGLELGAMLALAFGEQSGGTDFAAGPGIGLWAGYTGWVSANWALGGLLRASGAWMTGDASDGVGYATSSSPRREIDVTGGSIALCFNALYQ